MSKINWFTVIGILVILGAIATSAEIWINGGENYTSASRRGGVAEWITHSLTGLVGSKATALLNLVVLSGVGYAIYKLGQLRKHL